MKKITAFLIAATLLSGILPATILRATPVPDAGGPYVADEGAEVIFDAGASMETEGGSLEFRWDFDNDGLNDTAWSSSPTASHTWYDDWTGVVKVEVSNGTVTDTATNSVTINNVAPSVEAGPDQMVNEGNLISFSGSFLDPGTLDTHNIIWDFGDGNGDTGTLTPTHIYGDGGVYTVTLTVTDDDGGLGTDTLTVTVSDLAPTADFTWTPEPQNEGSPVIFTDASTSSPDMITEWSWGFGDGETSTLQNPTHAYSDDGVYTVTLTVTDEDSSTGTISHDVTILNVAPTAAIVLVTPPPVMQGDTVSFTGSAADPGTLDTFTFEWDFGDGTTASGENVDHAYANPGVYTVTLTVTDDEGGSGSDTIDLAISPRASVDIDPDTLNLKSRGRWITCYIELPEGYNIVNIDISTVTLSYGEGEVTAEWGNVQDGVLMVKFDRSEVADMLSPGNAVELTVRGQLTDLTPFEGSDTIRVISKGK